MASENQEEIKDILNKTEISLVLDTYDDIFSDFDPRPYKERALSQDFLIEAKRAAIETRSGVEIRFLTPKGMRDSVKEDIIKQRLKEHFKKHYKIAQKELANYKERAIIMVGLGIAIGFAVVWLTLLNLAPLVNNTIDIVGTPGSWFLIWVGFDHLVFKPEGLKDNVEFYRKFADLQVTFVSY